MLYTNVSSYYSAAFAEHCNAPASWVQAALAYNAAEGLHDSTCDSYTNNAARVDEERAAAGLYAAQRVLWEDSTINIEIH
nr:MAG TPA: hypothetical protein [Caudoviricetes sp.]